MNINKFTQKSLEAVQRTEKLAYEYGNQQIDQEHLLYSLLTIDDSLILKLITKMGIQENQFLNEVQLAIEKLPKVSGGQVYFSQDANKVLVNAEDEAKAMGDEYVSVEHLHAEAAKQSHEGTLQALQYYQRGLPPGTFHRQGQPEGGKRQPGGYLRYAEQIRV